MIICSEGISFNSSLYIWFTRVSKRLTMKVQISSVAQSCPTRCDPMNRSTPGLPVYHQLPESTQTHVHCRWWNLTISSSVIPFFSCPQSFPASGSFPMSQLFASGSQSIGVSASASVLPVSIQGWFPLGLTGLISLHSTGLSRAFSNKKWEYQIAWPASWEICMHVKKQQLELDMEQQTKLLSNQ